MMNTNTWQAPSTPMYRLFILALATLWATACGGGKEKNTTPTTSSPAPTAEKTTEPTQEASDETVTLVVNSDDQMRFDTDELRAKAGTTVSLTLNHTGKLPKAAMGHNLVILKAGTDIDAFAQQAIAAKANDYIPEGDATLAHTALIGGGESTSITFAAPPKGTYDFVCSFPGHYLMMKGKFIVE